MKPKPSTAVLLAALCLNPLASAATITWDGNGGSNNSGNWSTGLNWDSDTNPGPVGSDTAVLPDVTTGTRTVTLDSGAATPIGQIDFNQTTAGAFNVLDVTRNVTVTGPIVLGADAGTEELRLTPNGASFTLTASGGVTVNAGGQLTLGATSPANRYLSTVAGNVSMTGGTLLVTALEPTVANAVTRTINGTFTMSGGTITLDTTGVAVPNPLTDTRLQVNNNATITGGTITRIGTRQPQLVLQGTTINFQPTSVDSSVILQLSGGTQNVTVGTNTGRIDSRAFNLGPFTDTVTMTNGATLGSVNIGNNFNNGTSIFKLGSDITVTGNRPGVADSNSAGTVNLAIDTNGFTFSHTNTGAWTPPNGAANPTTRLINWSVINTGTAGQGGLKVGSASFTTANQVNLGAGSVLELTLGATPTATTSDLGGGGTIAPASLVRYAATSAVSNLAHTINSNRNLGHVEMRGTTPTHILNLESDPTWSVAGQLRVVQGRVNVFDPSKLGSSIVFSAANAPVGTNSSSTFASLAFDALATATAYSHAGPIDMTVMPSGHQGRSEFRLLGAVGDTSSLTLSGGVSLATAAVGGSSYRVSFSAQQPGQVIDISGPITGGGGVPTLLVNGSNVGTGTVRISNSGNSFTSGLTVVNGTLLVGANTSLGTGTSINMADGATPASGATLRLLVEPGITATRNINLSNASGGGIADLVVIGGTGAGSATIDSNIASSNNALNRNLQLTADTGGTVTINGQISANGDAAGVTAVAKAGPGTVVLNRAAGNTYDGDTTVSTGTLLLNNTSGSATGAGAVTVASSATLGGAGSFTGALSASGTVAPGNSTGTLGSGPATFETGSTLAIEIDDSQTPKNDTLAVNGALVINGGTFNLSVTGTPTQSVYTLITYTGTPPTGTFTTVNNQPPGYDLVYNHNGNSVALVKIGGDAYTSWIDTFVTITGADRAPDADPDNDGVENAIEFMTGTIPSDASSNNAPNITRNGPGDLVVTFNRADEAEAYEVAVEHSTGLAAPWTSIIVPNSATAGPPVTVVDNGSNADSVTVVVPANGDPRKFARVRVTVPAVP